MGPKMDPKIDPKIAQNARKARLRPRSLPGWILEPFLVDFGDRFGTLFESILTDFQQFFRICTNTRRYKQKGAKTHKIRANAGRYLQIRADTCKYAQIRAGTRTYVQKRANTWKHIQIHTDTRKYRVTNAARERAQRAQRAKCRKDTASSYAQLQGAPFSSVRRHVPASLIMITRFPFTYQTGFQKGFQKVLFFGIDFCIDFGVDLGSYFGLDFHDFQHFFSIHFLAMTFHVIMLVLGPVCVPLDVPEWRFYFRKTSIFMDLHVLAKLLELSQIELIFIDFWCQFWLI